VPTSSAVRVRPGREPRAPAQSADGDDQSTRRTILSRSGVVLAAGAGLAIAGCGSQHRRPHRKLSPEREHADIGVLNHLLGIEHVAAAAYTAGIPLLSGDIAADCRRFLDDELAHAGELFLLIKRQNGTPVKPQATYPLGGTPGSRIDVLTLLHTIERRQITAYLEAIPLVAPGAARAALAAILGSDAQHVAVVRGALGEAPLVGPFVTGAV
jgi:hypothetical protein